MTQQTQTDSLLLDIHDTVKSFLEEEISPDEAKLKYDSLLKRCIVLEKQKINHASEDYLTGMLYHHNVENFSKNTLLASLTGNSVNIINHCGDEKNLTPVKAVLQKMFSAGIITTNCLEKTKIPSSDDMSFTLYTWSFKNNNELIIIGSLTSSQYFDQEIFTSLVSFIEKNIRSNEAINLPVSIDYFNSISLELTSYIMNHLKNGTTVYGGIYIFDSIEKIFGHMGVATIADIATHITGTLTALHDTDYKCFILSLNNYITVASDPIEKISASYKHGIEFRYNDIAIPYKHTEIKIEHEKSIYDFWEELFIFENSIHQGKGSE